MKEYIILTIKDNMIIFNYRNITKEEETFINKNVIYNNSFYYDLKYFKKKFNNIIKQFNNINTLRIERLITFKYAYDLINGLNIENLFLNFLSTIDVEDYNLFLECSCLKNIYCYFMSSEYISKFKEKNINVIMSQNYTFSYTFMKQLDSDSKDLFYYKKIIYIKEDYPTLLEDLSEFLKINYKLKAIHICVYSKEIIKGIVDLVKNDESRNVVIFLHQEYDKDNFITSNFVWLKELSNICKKDYTCEFRIIYSNSFVGKNLFKQLTYNNLKLIMILFVYVSIVSLVIYKSYEYIEELSIESLNNELSTSISENALEDEELPDVQEEVEEEEEVEEKTKSKYDLENSFDKLKKINKETVGYIVVNNTQISYPVVQHSDNSYYLKYDFYKRKYSIGWIYMDYRNNINNNDDNIIIYGHNMNNGTMFGSLKNVLSSSWRKEEENMIISFDTEKEHRKYKIFSAYKVDYTTDYLITNFETTNDKEEFIKMIRERSSFKSDVSVGVSSQILTLSTCSGSNNKRLVVHAVLMEE